jgi:hypothetical protein
MPDEPIIMNELSLTPEAIGLGVTRARQIVSKNNKDKLIQYLIVDPEKMDDTNTFDRETKDFWCLYKYGGKNEIIPENSESIYP